MQARWHCLNESPLLIVYQLLRAGPLARPFFIRYTVSD